MALIHLLQTGLSFHLQCRPQGAIQKSWPLCHESYPIQQSCLGAFAELIPFGLGLFRSPCPLAMCKLSLLRSRIATSYFTQLLQVSFGFSTYYIEITRLDHDLYHPCFVNRYFTINQKSSLRLAPSQSQIDYQHFNSPAPRP